MTICRVNLLVDTIDKNMILEINTCYDCYENQTKLHWTRYEIYVSLVIMWNMWYVYYTAILIYNMYPGSFPYRTYLKLMLGHFNIIIILYIEPKWSLRHYIRKIISSNILDQSKPSFRSILIKRDLWIFTVRDFYCIMLYLLIHYLVISCITYYLLRFDQKSLFLSRVIILIFQFESKHATIS